MDITELTSAVVDPESWFPALSSSSLWVQYTVGLAFLSLLALVVGWATSRLLSRFAERALSVVGHKLWGEALERNRVFRYLGLGFPLLVIMSNIDLLPLESELSLLLARVFLVLGAFFCFVAGNRALSAAQDVFSRTARAQTRSVKGYVQLAKLLLWIVCAITLVSLATDRSPLLMLSGLGALSAVLLLVFKDTLLSLVASTQLSANDMLRIGDWIEMPQAGADGAVIDMALNTVKVQNWDNTVTTIPTYKLFSESYKNWRYMFESGGRRIKRSLRIDAGTVRFLSQQEIAELARFSLLKDYLQSKEKELEASNQQLGALAELPGNRRRLTNIGTFRAYALAYLKQRSDLRQDMSMMVRMMEPGSEGIPVEVYCFSKTTVWAEYEDVQGAVFDHLLAILPELSLRLYQSPSGSDFALGWRQGHD